MVDKKEVVAPMNSQTEQGLQFAVPFDEWRLTSWQVEEFIRLAVEGLEGAEGRHVPASGSHA